MNKFEIVETEQVQALNINEKSLSVIVFDKVRYVKAAHLSEDKDGQRHFRLFDKHGVCLYEETMWV